MSAIKQEVQKIDEPQTLAQVPETTALISMIERAARDQSVDIDKMERLVAMQERMIMQRNEQAFNVAMSAAQAEMGQITRDSDNKQTKSRYASYSAIDKVIRPVYTKHGFALSFDTGDGAPPDHVRILCYVTNSGFTRTYKTDMPADGKGAKGGDVMTKTHAMGAAKQYGQRYLVKDIFNLAIGGDDDGNSASGTGEKVTEKQAMEIIDLLEVHNKDRAKFLKWAKVETVEDITAEFYESCVAAIKQPVAK